MSDPGLERRSHPPLALLFLLTCLLASPATADERQGEEIVIDAHQLARWLGRDDVVVLDVRERSDYDRGHLPGALHVALQPAEVADGVEAARRLLGAVGLSGEETVVLYGDARLYQRIGWLFWLLEWAGQKTVRVLDGGIDSWHAGSGPIERKARSRPPTTFEPGETRTAAVTSDWLRDNLGLAGIQVLDLRDGEWQAAPSHSKGSRRGHVPHSLPYDFNLSLPRDGYWPEPLHVARRLGLLGPRPGDRIDLHSLLVLYGQSFRDPDPTLGYLLLRTTGADVRVLSGGWNEWLAEPASPVVRILPTAELAERLEQSGTGSRRDLSDSRLALIDVRNRGHYQASHLPGAHHLSSGLSADEIVGQLHQHWPELDLESDLVVFYCYGRSCIRSREMSTRAAQAGVRNIGWYRGGMEAWRARPRGPG